MTSVAIALLIIERGCARGFLYCFLFSIHVDAAVVLQTAAGVSGARGAGRGTQGARGSLFGSLSLSFVVFVAYSATRSDSLRY